jgi:hypothetical protein
MTLIFIAMGLAMIVGGLAVGIAIQTSEWAEERYWASLADKEGEFRVNDSLS